MTVPAPNARDSDLTPAEEPLPPPAGPWLIALTGVMLLASALLHTALLRAGVAWETVPRLATSAAQALLVGVVFMQIGWRRPFAMFLWLLFVLFLAGFAFVVVTDVAAHAGPPMWAR